MPEYLSLQEQSLKHTKNGHFGDNSCTARFSTVQKKLHYTDVARTERKPQVSSCCPLLASSKLLSLPTFLPPNKRFCNYVSFDRVFLESSDTKEMPPKFNRNLLVLKKTLIIPKYQQCYKVPTALYNVTHLGDFKDSACQYRRCRSDPCPGKIPLEEEMATHSSILAWKIPWTEEPGGLQSMTLLSRTQ